MAPKVSGSIRITLLEECPVVRDGLVQWLGRHSDCEVCGQISSLAETAASLARTKPDVLVMDFIPNGGDGVNFIRDLLVEHPGVRVLVFSMHDERHFAERVLRAGAMGFVAKNAVEAEFLSAVRTVAAGGIYVSPRLSLVLLGRLLRPTQKTSDKSGIASLTDRELHVFQLLGAGLGVRDIGTRLGVSTKTVHAHRENIKNKLGFETSAELLRHAALWITQQSQSSAG
jgi:DNA-binding NarL/FixJ family response regulator